MTQPQRPQFQTFGQYLLLDRLACGGMAEIYLGRPLAIRGDGRIVVVKRVLPQVADDPNFINMFRTETRVCVGFNHPNIVQMYDFGQVDRQPYIAMEYVEGRNLQDLMSRFLKQGKTLPLNVALTIVGRAADALHYAHSFRNRVTGEKICIVHRDVSPQNVLVSYDGKVKLIDFGIAKPGGERGEQTRMGTIKGKIAYLSPEQVRCEPLDGRSDVFSLGIVLWELLAGKRLFNPAGSNDFQVIQTIAACDKHIRPPSSFNPEVPTDLDAIVMKALKEKKDERYMSAAEFQADLRKFIVEGLPGSSFEQIAETMQQTFGEEMMRGREYVIQLDRAAQHFMETMHDLPAGTVAMPTSLIHAPAMAAAGAQMNPAAPMQAAPAGPPVPERPLGFGGAPQAVGEMTRSGRTSMTRLMAARVSVPGEGKAPPAGPPPVPPQQVSPLMADAPVAKTVASASAQSPAGQNPAPTPLTAPYPMGSMMGPSSFSSYAMQPPPGYGSSTRTSALGTGSPYYATGTSTRAGRTTALPDVNQPAIPPPPLAASDRTRMFNKVTRLKVLFGILYFSTIWFIKADQEYLFFERFFISTEAVREAAHARSKNPRPKMRLAQQSPVSQVGPERPTQQPAQQAVAPAAPAAAQSVAPAPEQAPAPVAPPTTTVAYAPQPNAVNDAEPSVSGPPAYVPTTTREGAPTDPGQARLRSTASVVKLTPTGKIPNRSVQLRINIQPKVTTVPTRLYVNEEQIENAEGVITVPLDQLVSIRVERPLYHSYKNSFVLNSRDLKPGGRFDLDINLKVFR